MGRYTGNVVTATNPFLGNTSMESNEVDPNSDNNPILDTQKTDGEPDNSHGEDFQVEGEGLVKVETMKPDDAIEEGEVLSKTTEVNNIVKDGDTTGNVIEALAAVSIEMYDILQNRGKMSAGEFVVLQGVVASCESLLPTLKESETGLPSLEDFKIPGLEYTYTDVSMEGIMDKLRTAGNDLQLNLTRLFKNGVGLANSLTPMFDKQLARARSLQGSINTAHRDAGEKTVSGKFVKALAVDNRSPDAATVLKTAKYMGEVTSELLTFKATDLAGQHLSNALKFIDSGVDFTKMEKPSMWLMFLIWIAKGAKVIDHPIANIASSAGEAAEREVNRRVFDKLRLSGDMAPELFSVYPSIAKTNTASDSKNLDARRSLPMFGNSSLVISQYAKEINMTMGHTAVPSIKLQKGKGWNSQAGKEMQSLTSQQQKEAVDSAITMLEAGREYFKNYAVRNGKCMETYQKAFQMKLGARKESKANGFGGADKYILPVYNFYTKLYWRGIFADQSSFATHARASAKALLDLVQASAGESQGGPDVSQEAFADFM